MQHHERPVTYETLTFMPLATELFYSNIYTCNTMYVHSQWGNPLWVLLSPAKLQFRMLVWIEAIVEVFVQYCSNQTGACRFLRLQSYSQQYKQQHSPYFGGDGSCRSCRKYKALRSMYLDACGQAYLFRPACIVNKKPKKHDARAKFT